MPLLHVTVSGKQNAALAKEIAQQIGVLTKDILRKRSEVTVVTVTFIPDELWFVNQESLAELNRQSFHLSIKFSESTNLKDDKARFIEAVHHTMVGLLQNMHPVSYTTIEEQRADAYGYEGLTIEHKIISNRIKQ
ncbi:4-oxalocrotonate tautomerase [Filimonas zeae]|uniref:4-oxalocrotonate tautomerase n=1 Tax=Filimonas zeae TaxID=1737353 RepID=A0A917IN62_9BACT|nr:4-oxalocrotonate tautomerase [Filimonas zeae]MDR6337615.1 4-oxalocrotonate tautomerase [Filimonas zeae]GGH59468.1 hypothetical protein GCM10011379_06270 [Filimonas zeae]